MSETSGPDGEEVDRLYILVCKGDTCSQKGNVERLRIALKQAARDFPAKAVKVAYSTCLGMCGDGPNILVCRGGAAHHRCSDKAISAVSEEVRGYLAGKPDP